MVDLAKIEYRVVVVTPEGKQLDITPATTNLGWEEGEKELSVRISLKIYNGEYAGKMMSELVQPNTPIFVYCVNDGTAEEVTRGTVEKWVAQYSNGQTVLDITAYDEMNALRHNQDSKYYSEGTGTKAIITDIFGKWGVPFEYKGPDVAHGKTAFKHKYLSDMITQILGEAKKKGAGVYFARANKGKVEIIPRGSNETTYHFDAADNVEVISDSFDASKIVTRVVIVGKSDKEGHEPVQAIVDGKTEFGTRQIIYEMPKDKTLDEAKKTADEMLKEKGGLERKTPLTAPDLPFLRKGDRIRVNAASAKGYYFVKSIRHNAEDRKMTFEIDEDKERNGATIDTNSGDESSEVGDEA